MFRLSRAFRLRQQYPISRQITRVPRRAESRLLAQHDAVRFQKVRFQKPGITFKRVATFALYTGATYAYLRLIWSYLDVDIEIVDEEEVPVEEKQGDGVEVEDEGPLYADEDSTFVPLTWAQKMPRTYYKGSDSEWQEFVKVAKDSKRHKKIQNELVQIVYTGTLQHPAISRQLGKEPKLGKYWLDISFPDGPPQEYERSGIEIGDGYVAWSMQKVTPENQWRVQRALWPKAAFDSVWATSKVLFGIQLRRVKQALGLEGRDPFSPEERYKHAVEMMQKQQAAKQRRNIGSAQTDPDSSPSAVLSSAASSPGAKATPAASEGKRLPWGIEVPMPPTQQTSMDLPIAMHVFSHTLSKQWNPKKMEPPRGTFVVQGLVEVKGSRGRMMFDVQSCYDPKVNKFVQVNAGVRNVKKWNQSPRGGP